MKNLKLSCQKNGLPINTNVNSPAAGKSSLSVFLTDDQSLVFEHIFPDIRQV